MSPTSLPRVFWPPSLFSPDGRAFVDHYSTVRDPGRTLLRSTEDGTVIAELERPDASLLWESGWRALEPFAVKAADGETELHGVLYRPADGAQNPAPLIDCIYAGPQVSVVPHDFRSARSALGGTGRASLAALGFAVAVVDGRGTPLRSRAFHDAGFAAFPDLALDDHVAALRQLCARDPSLDAGRVGVYGHSFGGYTSARAILRHPDVFKVCVSSAGCHNFQGMNNSAARLYLQPPEYGAERPDEGAVPTNYARLDNAALAGRLTGKLLLAYGDLDENAYPAVTLDLVRALIEHNRSPDLLYPPNRAHGFAREPYFVRRLWDYFVMHLMGERPPRDFLLELRGSVPWQERGAAWRNGDEAR